MLKRNFSDALVGPSVLSGSVTVLIFVTICLFEYLPVLKNNFLYNDYLLGKNSSGKSIINSSSTLKAFLDSVFNSKITNEVVLIAFWAIVGLISYIILNAIIVTVKSSVKTVEQMGYINSQKAHLLETFTTRLSIRMIIGILWGLYFIVFTRFLIPFSLLCLRAGSVIFHSTSWLYVITASLILIMSLHLNVIFLRLFLLRARVFGGVN